MIAGTVIFYNAERGFGYIKPGNGERDIRVLAEILMRAGLKGLSKGQKVKFESHTDSDSGKITVGAIELG